MDADGMRCVRQIEEMKKNGKLSLIRHYHIFQRLDVLLQKDYW